MRCWTSTNLAFSSPSPPPSSTTQYAPWTHLQAHYLVPYPLLLTLLDFDLTLTPDNLLPCSLAPSSPPTSIQPLHLATASHYPPSSAIRLTLSSILHQLSCGTLHPLLFVGHQPSRPPSSRPSSSVSSLNSARVPPPSVIRETLRSSDY